jgi:hypothetical protein
MRLPNSLKVAFQDLWAPADKMWRAVSIVDRVNPLRERLTHYIPLQSAHAWLEGIVAKLPSRSKTKTIVRELMFWLDESWSPGSGKTLQQYAGGKFASLPDDVRGKFKAEDVPHCEEALKWVGNQLPPPADEPQMPVNRNLLRAFVDHEGSTDVRGPALAWMRAAERGLVDLHTSPAWDALVAARDKDDFVTRAVHLMPAADTANARPVLGKLYEFWHDITHRTLGSTPAAGGGAPTAGTSGNP